VVALTTFIRVARQKERKRLSYVFVYELWLKLDDVLLLGQPSFFKLLWQTNSHVDIPGAVLFSNQNFLSLKLRLNNGRQPATKHLGSQTTRFNKAPCRDKLSRLIKLHNNTVHLPTSALRPNSTTMQHCPMTYWPTSSTMQSVESYGTSYLNIELCCIIILPKMLRARSLGQTYSSQ